jgi:putative flippase GtrA
VPLPRLNLGPYRRQSSLGPDPEPMTELSRHLAVVLSDRAERQRLIRFALVGASNGALTLTVYLFAIALGVWYPLAASLGYLAGIVNGYTWNMRWTFRTGSFHRGEFLRYVLVAAAGLLASAAGVAIAVGTLGMQKLTGEIASLIPIVLSTYLANRAWVFRSRMESG